MNKSVECLLLLFSLTIVFLLPQSAPGQARISLEKGTGKKTSNREVGASSKIVKPSGQAEENRPVVLVQPSPQLNSATTESATPKRQTAEAPGQSAITECSWALLLLNEVGSYYLTITGVTCLGCNLPTELSQTTLGVLGFSHSPSGPWSETLTVYTQLDFSGNGTSENFYIKGQAPGISTFHGQNFWSSFDVDFQVVPCTCPEIPIVP